MSTPRALLVGGLLAAGLTGCTTVQFTNKYVEAPGILRVHLDALDPFKKRLWILDAALENVSDEQIIVQLRDITCHRGEHEGKLEYQRPFGIGERTIDLAPGEKKRFDIKCAYSPTKPPPEGDTLRLHIARVFADKVGDGRSLGDVIARDIEWSYLIEE